MSELQMKNSFDTKGIESVINPSYFFFLIIILETVKVARTEAVFLHLPGQDKNVAVWLDTEPSSEKVEGLSPC